VGSQTDHVERRPYVEEVPLDAQRSRDSNVEMESDRLRRCPSASLRPSASGRQAVRDVGTSYSETWRVLSHIPPNKAGVKAVLERIREPDVVEHASDEEHLLVELQASAEKRCDGIRAVAVVEEPTIRDLLAQITGGFCHVRDRYRNVGTA
jgi:hypothetical protein